MNLTYLIGNGFDIGLGLKTSYRDFLNCYLCDVLSKGDSPSVTAFKKIIRNDIDKWADAEEALGKIDYQEFGKECDIGLQGGATTAFNDICDKIKKYISSCEEKFPRVISDDISSRFRQALISIHTGLVDADVRSRFMSGVSRIDVNFINFNYTRTLSALIGNIPDVSSIDVDGNKVGANFHLPLHIHGRVSDLGDNGCNDIKEIVFGIGDGSQLTGLPYEGNMIQFEQVRAIMEKQDKDMSKKSYSSIAKAISVLMQSDYIVLFGASIGITDCFWWNAIVKFLHENSKMKIVYVPHHFGCGVNSRNVEEEEKQFVAERFASSTKCKMSAEDFLKQFGERILVISSGPHRDFDGNLHCYDPLHLTWFKHQCLKPCQATHSVCSLARKGA